MKTVDTTFEYKGYTVKYKMHYMNAFETVWHFVRLKYLGWFWGMGNDVTIDQWIPAFFRKKLHKKTLIHELGHLDQHILCQKYDPSSCQEYHDSYDRLTWHGLLQYKYTYKPEIPKEILKIIDG